MKAKHFQEALKYFLQQEQRVVVRVAGKSMQPTLFNGQSIPISLCKKELVTGKCYVFEYNGVCLLHRLVWHTKTTAFFLGDNGTGIQKVDKRAVVAQVSCKENVFKRFLITFVNYAFCCACKISVCSHYSLMVKRIFIQHLFKGEKLYERAL